MKIQQKWKPSDITTVWRKTYCQLLVSKPESDMKARVQLKELASNDIIKTLFSKIGTIYPSIPVTTDSKEAFLK